MKKIFILLTLIMIPLLSVDTYANDDLTTLRVYYYRYDDTYTGFNMWVWENLPVARGGKQWDFTATNSRNKSKAAEGISRFYKCDKCRWQIAIC